MTSDGQVRYPSFKVLGRGSSFIGAVPTEEDGVFGIFKKATAKDGVIRAMYGEHPPAKSADLEPAIALAYADLLCEAVPASAIRRTAVELAAGPVPYSTHELAVATALAFLKDPELVGRLREIQIAARLCALNWMKAGKVAPGVRRMFEDTLYRIYDY